MITNSFHKLNEQLGETLDKLVTGVNSILIGMANDERKLVMTSIDATLLLKIYDRALEEEQYEICATAQEVFRTRLSAK